MALLDRRVFGLTLNASNDPRMFDLVRDIEAAGYDYVAVGEHLMFHGPVPNGIVTLSAAAAATERIELLSSITLVPMYPPALLAKMAIQIDAISGGRFNLGVGVGGEFPKEWELVGVPINERGSRTNESLEIIKKLFTGETVSHSGRHWSFTDARLQPPPTRPGGPPIWISGRRDAAISRAARYGDAWLPYMYTPEMVASSIAKMRELAPERDVSTVAYCFTTVLDDGDAAREMAAQRVGGTYQQDFTKMLRYLITGTPAECIARAQEYLDAGANGVVFSLACPADEYPRMLARLTHEVVPALR